MPDAQRFLRAIARLHEPVKNRRNANCMECGNPFPCQTFKYATGEGIA